MKIHKVSEIVIVVAIALAGLLIFGNWIDNRINRSPAELTKNP